MGLRPLDEQAEPRVTPGAFCYAGRVIVAVIPTLYRPPTLQPLLDVLKADDINVILIDTKGREPDIYRWWNEGCDEARARGATEIAVLNDDIVILPGTLPLMARAIREHGLGVSYPEVGKLAVPHALEVTETEGLWRGTWPKAVRTSDLGMTGFIFMFTATLPVRFDESYRWYAGDDAFEEAVWRAGYRVGCVRGLRIEHLASYSGKKSWSVLKDLARVDRERWRDRKTERVLTLNQKHQEAFMELDEPMTATSIPAVLHRIAIGPVPEDSQYFWDRWQELHSSWTCKTHAPPFDLGKWPLTGWAFQYCTSPAMQADLMRLEILWSEGGVYVDWDMEPYRALDAFLPLEGFAAFDAMTSNPSDRTWVGTGVLGFRPHHPAIAANLHLSLQRFRDNQQDIMQVGPLATDRVMRERDDVLLLPRASFYGWDRTDRGSITNGALAHLPWAYGLHRMHGSWENKSVPPSGLKRWVRPETKLF